MPFPLGDYCACLYVLGVGHFEFRPISETLPLPAIDREVLLKEIQKACLYLEALGNAYVHYRTSKLGGNTHV
jgi:hypothetical protein